MADVQYGVIRQRDGWMIIGDHLRFGSYSRRGSAIRAAKRLAAKSGGLPVKLHVQTETGELLPAVLIDGDA